MAKTQNSVLKQPSRTSFLPNLSANPYDQTQQQWRAADWDWF